MIGEKSIFPECPSDGTFSLIPKGTTMLSSEGVSIPDKEFGLSHS